MNCINLVIMGWILRRIEEGKRKKNGELCHRKSEIFREISKKRGRRKNLKKSIKWKF